MKFDRFKKVVVRDFHNTYSLFGMSMLILMLVPAFFWLLGLSFGEDEIPSVMRMENINFVVYLTAAISSMKIFGSCNLVGKGNYFAMLPASLGEKFWSMLLYCFVVCPLVVFAGQYVVDTLLTLLPFGPNKDFLWDIPEWKREMLVNGWGYSRIQEIIISAADILVVTSLFMLTNTIFKKNKFVKTILWLMLIVFVLIVVIVPILSHFDFDRIFWREWIEKILNNIEHLDQHTWINILFWLRLLINLAVSAVLLLITYRRLKKMQY